MVKVAWPKQLLIGQGMQQSSCAAAQMRRQKYCGASNRNRTGTPAMNEAADFKSAVSTYFTIEATNTSTELSNKNAPKISGRVEKY